MWELAYADRIGDRVYPTFAAKMAGVEGEPGETFNIDYSIRPESVPTVSAIDLIEGRVDPAEIEGKTLIVAITMLQLGDQFYIPGYGRAGWVPPAGPRACACASAR